MLQKGLFLDLVEKKKKGLGITTEHLLLTEHEPVITIGRHGKRENILYPEKMLKAQGIECIQIERGGDITYHGPGQLVAYPIIDLESHKLGVKDYVFLLEESIIRILEKYSIKGERVEGASGVWIGVGSQQERKICALGIKCSRYITMHGLAFNINTDLNGFRLINPCGFVDKEVTSMQRELGYEMDMNKIKREFADIFTELIHIKQ